ncbi:MAG: phosphatase PAP2 family protein [Clostridia bacterium]|nr:phosphatase PAP2 family protein [Clostridia bacterium]
MGILEWIRDAVVCDWLTPIFRIITFLGEFGAGWIAVALVLVCMKKSRKAGWTVGVALLLGLLLGEYGIKILVQRPRPFTELAGLQLLIPEPAGFSFPSGHTTSSFAAAVSLFFYHKKWGAAALAMAGLVGFSRMYFTVHYLTDVLFGIALGIACAFAARWIVERIDQKRRRKHG